MKAIFIFKGDEYENAIHKLFSIGINVSFQSKTKLDADIIIIIIFVRVIKKSDQ
jgi:hypothetical protein